MSPGHLWMWLSPRRLHAARDSSGIFNSTESDVGSGENVPEAVDYSEPHNPDSSHYGSALTISSVLVVWFAILISCAAFLYLKRRRVAPLRASVAAAELAVCGDVMIAAFNKLPRVRPEEASAMASDDVCSICLHQYSDSIGSEECSNVALPCLHLFHEPCIRRWLESSRWTRGDCPVCKQMFLQTHNGVQSPDHVPEAVH